MLNPPGLSGEPIKLRLTFKICQRDSVICHTKISMDQMNIFTF